MAVRVGKQLHFHVTWAAQGAFDQQFAVAERRLGFRACAVQRACQRIGRLHPAHAAAVAQVSNPGQSLNKDRLMVAILQVQPPAATAGEPPGPPMLP